MGFEGINVDIPQGEPAHCGHARELHPPAAYGKKKRRYAAAVGNVLFYAALFTVLSGSMEGVADNGV